MNADKNVAAMDIEEIKEKLEKNIKPNKYNHSINVMNTAMKLASYYGCDRRKAEIAGLLHDCAKGMAKDQIFELCKKANIEVDEIQRRQPDLLHGPVGAYIARTDYGIYDAEILEAINVHTTGKENMGMLDKIIFISDYIEPGRRFPGVETIRECAFKDINRALILGFDTTIIHVIEKGRLIHPHTIHARNYILIND